MKINFRGIKKLDEKNKQKVEKIAENAAKRIAQNTKKVQPTQMTMEIKDKGKELQLKIDTKECIALELETHWALEKINFFPRANGFYRTIKK